MKLLNTITATCIALSATMAFAGSTTAPTDANQSPLPIPQDPDASIDKAKPADEMVGETAPSGTTLDVDPDAATVDGVPRDAESAYVNTESDEAEVGIPDSD